MTQQEYDYMRRLPLVLHLPSLHTHVVHAGILPADPTKNLHSPKQPLSHLPLGIPLTEDNVEQIRTIQEQSILHDVPQNTKAWNKLNIRDVLRKGGVSRKAGSGTPWSHIWNEVMELCHGFEPHSNDQRRRLRFERDDEDLPDGLLNELDELKKKPLPCHPSSVIYGHSAGRGLDLKRWSQGLDTGCVYGRKLTAMLIGDHKSKGIDEAGGEEEIEEFRYGDTQKARLVSISCA